MTLGALFVRVEEILFSPLDILCRGGYGVGMTLRLAEFIEEGDELVGLGVVVRTWADVTLNGRPVRFFVLEDGEELGSPFGEAWEVVR